MGLPVLKAETEYWRPQTRADCLDGPRPCPYVGCKHHLAMDVRPVERPSLVRVGAVGDRNRTIRAASKDLETWTDKLLEELGRMSETCALDVADRGGITLDAVGKIIGITRERVRQLEAKAKSVLLANVGAGELREILDGIGAARGE